MLVAGRSGNCGVKRFLYAVMAGLVTGSRVYPTSGNINLRNSGKPELECPLARATDRKTAGHNLGNSSADA
jgi:hypothetical protein